MNSLEHKINETQQPRFRSEGERRIANTLHTYGIPFVYEQPISLWDNGKKVTLKPDFYLPNLGIFIEYYGRVTNPDYDQRASKKQTLYQNAGHPVVPIYPWNLCENWPDYLFKELHRYAHRSSQTRPSTKQYHQSGIPKSRHPGYNRSSTRKYRA